MKVKLMPKNLIIVCPYLTFLSIANDIRIGKNAQGKMKS